MSLVSLYDAASLWMTPSGAEDGKLFSQLPTDGSGDFTFSRGSNLAATRVGPTGLIEKGRENLLTQSNNFSATPWASSGTTETSGQSGYDGSSDAWLLSAANAGDFIYRNDITSFSGLTTISVYAKKGTADGIRLRFNQTTDVNLYINLAAGAIIGAFAPGIAYAIEDALNGWYRIQMSFIASGTQDFRIYPTNATGTSIAGTIYIQDAQAEIGLAATDYIESGATTGKAGLLENEPRLDYSGGATCPSLLLEPSRTNLVGYSEYFEGTGWTLGTGVLTSNTNETTSPEGLYNAAKLVDTNNATQLYYRGMSVTASTQYTFSFYAKGNISTPTLAVYDESNAAFIAVDVAYSISTDSWTRITQTITTPVGCTSLRVYPIRGTGSGTIYIWGAQVEQGSYPTSYIPTYGTSQTRSIDLTTADTSSFYTDSSKGTLFTELSFPLAADGNYNGWFFWNGSGYHRIVLQRRGDTGRGQIEVRINNTTQASVISSSAITLEDNHKMLVRWDGNVFTLFIDGVNIGNDTSTDVYSGTDLNELSSRPTYNAANIKQAVLFPTALNDSECIALTKLD